jgi:hypothetical protein
MLWFVEPDELPAPEPVVIPPPMSPITVDGTKANTNQLSALTPLWNLLSLLCVLFTLAVLLLWWLYGSSPFLQPPAASVPAVQQSVLNVVEELECALCGKLPV